MQKKLLVLAVSVACGLSAGAWADNGNVRISGAMNFSLDSLDGANKAGTDLTREWNVSSNSSNVVFSGDEDLGSGLKAIWQIQTFFSAGGTGNSDGGLTASPTSDGVGAGNTYLGLAGNFGAVLMGKHDTPMKLIGRKVDFFNNQIGDSRNIIGGIPGVAYGGSTLSLAEWDLRPQNVVAYASPDFNGFKVLAAYVTNVGSGAATDKSVTAPSINATYENGPLFVGAAYERHNWSNLGLSTNPEDSKAWRLAGGYNFGDFKVAALWQQSTDNYGVGGLDGRAWGLGGAYKMGGNTLKAQYYRAKSYDLTTNTGGSLWALGLDHALSKRTTVYVAYARANNDANAWYSAFGGGHGDNPGTVAGKDPSGFSLGIMHNF